MKGETPFAGIQKLDQWGGSPVRRESEDFSRNLARGRDESHASKEGTYHWLMGGKTKRPRTNEWWPFDPGNEERGG